MRSSSLKTGLLTAAALAAGVVVFALPVLVAAQAPDLGLNYATAIGLGTTDIRTTVARVISYFLALLGIVAVCLILYAGFLWMTAQGDQKKVDTAKKIIINGVIGLAIILSAYAITRFIFGAVSEEAGIGGAGCPPGQTCAGGGGLTGGGNAFLIDATAPAGPGPGNGGWPKNAALTISFNAAVAADSVTDASIVVKRCNSRLSGDTPQPFQFSACDTVVAGTRTPNGGRIEFRPSNTPEDPLYPEISKTYWEGDYWYYVQAKGGVTGFESNAVKDAGTPSRVLMCVSPLGVNIWDNTIAAQRLCDRAFAMSDVVDLTPPTVEVYQPKSPPAYCAADIPVQVGADDDFAVSRVDLKLDLISGTGDLAVLQSALLDDSGAAASSAANGTMAKPFTINGWRVDGTKLTAGETYGLIATAQDLIPQASAPHRSDFSVKPAHCCNGVKDTAEKETDIDCGADSGCGLCVGASCTGDAQCASGYCDPATGKCAERPIIEGVAPTAGGPGSLMTVTGVYFGNQTGSVVFLGGPGDGDDKIAALCDPTKAWVRKNDGTYEVTVIVPEGAVDGPIKLVSASGLFDTTDVAPGWNGSFDVNDQLLPGLCYLDPSSGSSGSQFGVVGSGFGSTMAAGSQVTIGTVSANVAAQGWAETGTRINAVVPVMKDGAYPVKVRVGDAASGKTAANSLTFAVRPKEGEQQPKITEIQPAIGPSGSLITIIGSGFGSEKGKVVFTRGGDQGSGVDPDVACGDTWHDKYIIIKVPTDYDCDTKPCGLAFSDHAIQVTTQAAKNSNIATFSVNGDPLRPGLCALRPDNGPAGIEVEVIGDRFGAGGIGTNEVEFFKQPNTVKTPAGYRSWSETLIATSVPGNRGDKATWPDTGPVKVVATNVPSGNSIPFTVQDCNETKDCPADVPVCCPSGACQATEAACVSAARNSALGWHFSTEVLPELPRVVECSSCNTAECPLQSPSPFRNSQDACVNASLHFVFNRAMDPASVVPGGTAKITACGTGDAPDCQGASIGFQTWHFDPTGTILTLVPTSALTRKGWYRVQIEGLKDTTLPAGRTLDGDLDGSQGGAYKYDFRVRDSASPCKMSSVRVIPTPYNFEEWLFTAKFQSILFADNCNSIWCPPGSAPYAISWSKTEPDPASPRVDIPATAETSGACPDDIEPVTALLETLPGQHVELYANVTPADSSIKTTGTGEITVNFREPEVVAYVPKCDQACVNSALVVEFSVPMDGPTPYDQLGSGPDSLTSANFELWKCRNADCQPPFESGAKQQLQTPVYYPEMINNGSGTPVSTVRKVSLSPTAGLQASTWYLAKVKGGDAGVKSVSGAQLIGVDAAGYFTWKFRTRDDASPCRPTRAEISPDKVEFRYVGERASLLSTPFGSPDGCSAEGQALSGWSYGWKWTQADSSATVGQGVIGSFIQKNGLLTTAGQLDVGAVSKLGCGGNCLHLGSQNVTPQCGNGVKEKGEACDDGNNAAGDKCSPACLLEGTVAGTTAGTCGNGGTPETGENCEKVSGVFPPGCKDPAVNVTERPDLNGKGCVLLGAAAGGTVCGNALLGDGEECDDGNKTGGDGCSADCLLEGTLPACADSRGTCSGTPNKKCSNMPGQSCATDADCLAPCAGFCGNKKTDPGEDAGCDTPSGIAAGCDPKTCLRTGNTASTCGNGTLQSDKGEQCDDGNTADGDGCSSRCLREGSSAGYAAPSFCRDGVPGTGEEPDCEGGYAAPDRLIDPFQMIVAGKPVAADQTGGKNTAEGKVYADLSSPTLADKRGVIDATLSCTCLKQTNPQNFCYALGSLLKLGCDKNGCCAPAPQVVQPVRPSGSNVCRNAVARVKFDQYIDPKTAGSLIVGKLTSSATCNYCSNDHRLGCSEDADCGSPPNTCQVNKTPPFTVAMVDDGLPGPAAGKPSLWGRITGFIRSFFGREAVAASSGFCPWPGTVSAVAGEVAFYPKKAMDANADYKIVLVGDNMKASLGDPIVSVDGVPLRLTNYYSFTTGTQVCKMDKMEIVPGSYLFTRAEHDPNDEQSDGDDDFEARGYSSHDGVDVQIASTPDYSFKWVWDRQTTESVIDLTALQPGSFANNGFCEKKSPANENGNSADCKINLAAAAAPKPEPGCGNGVCESGEFGTCADDCDSPIGDSNTATVKVRTPNPKNGEATVTATAWIMDRGVNPSWVSVSSQVTVMLCDNPWPSRRECLNGSATVPWAAGQTYSCPAAGSFWVPFFDPDTKFSFYYCRDGAAGGGLLPEIKEDEVVKIKPGRDIFREYLFTFEPAGAGAAWEDDAIGLRIVTNPEHYGIARWYSSQGFGGSPAAATVDGYDALTEGRTTYVGAGAVGAANLFTNVNVLSYSEGAAPETAAVFSQVLADSNHNYGLSDDRYCVEPDGKQIKDDTDKPVFCLSDRDCRVGADGKVISGRESWRCSADKTMLIRDVKRWADIQTMRLSLDAAKSATGSAPKLEAGSFLRAVSVSRWPSWTDALAAELGSVLPSDPLNTFMPCDPADPKYDQATCWNSADRLFKCPSGSHVYQYQSAGGAAYILSADLELAGRLGKTWAAENCLMKSQANCTGGCVWDPDLKCQYANSGLTRLYGANAGTPACNDNVIGANAVCGDGIIQSPGEDCEPGIPVSATEDCSVSKTCSLNRSAGCSADADCAAGGQNLGTCGVPLGASTPGKRVQGCSAATCKYQPIPGPCYLNYCGDGKVGGTEKCDDGALNGTYGSCNTSCSGFFGCGDGQRQPYEACDCHGGVPNGTYAFNGILAPAGTACETGTNSDIKNAKSCSWDCKGPGPRCGDSVVNGSEKCDGGTEEFPKLCGDGVTGCSTDADCSGGKACSQACPTPDQKWHRSCAPNDPNSQADDNACTWGVWKCTAPGFCGNGVKESGEPCDDGNDDNTDACVITGTTKKTCVAAYCGDGFIQAGVDQCDLGSGNGHTCVPDWGKTCQYCNLGCKVISISGGFCGDAKVQNAKSNPPGPEDCEKGIAITDAVCVDASKCQAEQLASISCSSSCSYQCAPAAAVPCVFGTETADFDHDGIPDICDPDKDNDGVPDGLDCAPMVPAIHPAYAACGVDAAQEVCNGKDDDCNGLTDNIVTIKGQVVDAKTNKGIDGAVIDVLCGDTVTGQVIGQAKTGSDGYYTLSAFDTGSCGGKWTVIGDSTSSNVCVDPADAVIIPIDSSQYCKRTVNVNKVVVAVDRPPVGGRVAYITWGATPLDIDFYMKTSASQCIGYYCDYNRYNQGDNDSGYTIDDGNNVDEVHWDIDDTNGNGPETMTFASLVAGKRYKFYAHNYSGGSFGGQEKFRMVDSNCTFYTKVIPSAGTERCWDIMTMMNGSPIAEPNKLVSCSDPAADIPAPGFDPACVAAWFCDWGDTPCEAERAVACAN